MPSLLIIGCGYSGRAVAQQFQKRGWDVLGWCRSAESAAALLPLGIRAHHGNCCEPADWRTVPKRYDLALYCVATRGGGPEAYRAAYLHGMHQASRQLTAETPLLFTSSTSVYAQQDAEWVTEESLAEPDTEGGKILRETEELCLRRGGAVLRLAGIYGPGRSHLVRSFLAGTAALDEAGERWMNHVHLADIASAVAHLAAQFQPGLFNCTDSEPAQQRAVHAFVAQELAVAMSQSAATGACSTRKRGNSNKRVSNAKLLALGWQPQFPSFREGYRDVIPSLRG